MMMTTEEEMNMLHDTLKTARENHLELEVIWSLIHCPSEDFAQKCGFALSEWDI